MAQPVSRPAGRIAIQNVTFGYDPARPVLHGVSLTIERGESLALIGPSGAGKTTLLHLIPRFHDPGDGTVKLDGVDLRDLQLKALRSQISLVLQEPILLSATIAENIAYGRPDATALEIENAARAAHAAEFIRALPSGFETLVGEGSARLSVGEKQRINLARAFLKDAPILLFDEPTSALDSESETLVFRSLRKLIRGRTAVLVAHRLQTIRNVDRIVVMEGGRITDQGPPEELRRRAGYYRRALSGGEDPGPD